jgi:predicted DNA-binding protein (MmcQ/YjbR family)
MNIEELREYCLKKRGTTEALPFDEYTLVFKVMGKIFLITSLNEPHRFNAKCDPERAIELREQHDEIKPGWHMNKKHWNTVHTDGNLSLKQIRDIIDHSYELVRDSLPKKIRDGLK